MTLAVGGRLNTNTTNKSVELEQACIFVYMLICVQFVHLNQNDILATIKIITLNTC